MNVALLVLSIGGIAVLGRQAYGYRSARLAGTSRLDAFTRIALTAFFVSLFLAGGVAPEHPGVQSVLARIVLAIGVLLVVLALVEGLTRSEVQAALRRLGRLPGDVVRSWREYDPVALEGRQQTGRELRTSPRWMTAVFLAALIVVSLLLGLGLREGPPWELMRILAGMWLVSMLVGTGAPILVAWAVVAVVSNRLGTMRLLKVVADAAGVGLAIGVVLGIVAFSMEFSGMFEVSGGMSERADVSANSIFVLSTVGAIVGALFGFLRSASDLHRHFRSPRVGIVLSVVLPTVCALFLGLVMGPETIAHRLIEDALVGMPEQCSESVIDAHGVVAALRCKDSVDFLYGVLPSAASLALLVGGALCIFGAVHVYNGSGAVSSGGESGSQTPNAAG